MHGPDDKPAPLTAYVYWAIAELGITMTHLARLLKISQPAVSICARRGEQIDLAEGFRMIAE